MPIDEEVADGISGYASLPPLLPLLVVEGTETDVIGVV